MKTKTKTNRPAPLSDVLDAAQIIAVTSLVKESAQKTARAALDVGTHDVDITLRVVGTIDVASDTTRVPTVSIPLKEVLALFIARAGGTREGSIALLRGCMADALALGPEGVGAIADVVDIDAVYVEQVQAITASLPRTPVRGAVRADLRVEVIRAQPDGLVNERPTCPTIEAS